MEIEMKTITVNITYITKSGETKESKVTYEKGYTYGVEEENFFNAILDTCPDIKKLIRIGI